MYIICSFLPNLLDTITAKLKYDRKHVAIDIFRTIQFWKLLNLISDDILISPHDGILLDNHEDIDEVLSYRGVKDRDDQRDVGKGS